MQSEKLMMMGETVHTDAARDVLMVGRVIGWSTDGTRPRIKLDKDPAVVSRVGNKQVVECIPYSGPLESNGLPPNELEGGGIMCWVPEYDETGDGLVAEWDVSTESALIIDHPETELTQVEIDQNTEEAEGLADGFDGATDEQQDDGDTGGSDDDQGGSDEGDGLEGSDETGSTDDSEESDAEQPQTV